MRGWRKKHTTKTNTVHDNIKQRFLQQCQRLVGVTKGDFQTLYYPVIENVMQYCRQPNQPLDSVQFFEHLQPVLIALKRRRGYSLPLGEDTEVIFKEKEQWTYAVFAASCLQIIDSNVKYDVGKALIPANGFDWLHRNQPLFQLWQTFLKKQPDDNIFTEIIEPIALIQQEIKVAITDNNKPPKETPVAIAKDTTENNVLTNQTDEQPETSYATSVKASNRSISDSEKIKMALPVGTIISEQSLSTVANTDNNATDTLSPKHNTKDVTEAENALPSNVPQYSADYLLRWLKKSIESGRLTINQDDSILFGSHDGLVIHHAKLIDEFLNDEAKENQVPLAILSEHYTIKLTKWLKNHPWLIRYDKERRIQSYCLGDSDKHNTFEGMTLNTEQFLGDEWPLSIYPELMLDPLYDGIDTIDTTD